MGIVGAVAAVVAIIGALVEAQKKAREELIKTQQAIVEEQNKKQEQI